MSLGHHIDEAMEGQCALKKTVFLKSKPGALAAAAAFIYASGPSTYGLQLRFEVLKKYRHHGVAYEDLQMFLNEYWRRERFGPYDKMFCGATEPPDDSESTHQANSPTLRLADDPGVANTVSRKLASPEASASPYFTVLGGSEQCQEGPRRAKQIDKFISLGSGGQLFDDERRQRRNWSQPSASVPC